MAMNFGKKRLNDFYLDPKYINVNHGSYGSCPKAVLAVKREYEERMDWNTQKWFRIQAEKEIANTRKSVAARIGCKSDNLHLVQNATDAYNCLMKSLSWTDEDTILLPNTAYASIRKTTLFLQQRFNFKILEIAFTQQDFKSPQAILLKIENTVNSYPKQITLAVIDHIISVPAIICPVEPIVEFMKQKNIPIFIDGAHAIGQIPIDISAIEPDAYFSNFHKWAFAPKNAAFLYLSDKLLKKISPAITGNFYGQGPARQFFWTGTRDLTSFMAIEAAYAYQTSFGKNEVQRYNHKLVFSAARQVAKIWNTSLLTEDERCTGSMCNIQVPSQDWKKCQEVATHMMQVQNCYPVLFQFHGKIYCRISAQVYNQMSDYEFMATKFKQLMKNN